MRCIRSWTWIMTQFKYEIIQLDNGTKTSDRHYPEGAVGFVRITNQWLCIQRDHFTYYSLAMHFYIKIRYIHSEIILRWRFYTFMHKLIYGSEICFILLQSIRNVTSLKSCMTRSQFTMIFCSLRSIDICEQHNEHQNLSMYIWTNIVCKM